MAILWKKGATIYQKIAITVLVALIVWPFQVLFSHSFVPSAQTLRLASYSSIFLTVSYISLMVFIARTTPPSSGVLSHYSRLKRVAVIAFIPFMIYGLFWINVAVSAPQAFTILFGTAETTVVNATKRNVHSRRNCDFRLKPTSIDFILFYYCIPYQQYVDLPERKFSVELSTSVSNFGFHVDEITIVREGPQ